jgi:hypothetical protein
MNHLFWFGFAVFVGLPLVALGALKLLSPRGLPADFPDPIEIEPEPLKRKDTCVIVRAQIGLAVVELTEEMAVTAGVPRFRRRRTVVVRGYVTTTADAKALADTIRSYGEDI